jgi:hypothetical protein
MDSSEHGNEPVGNTSTHSFRAVPHPRISKDQLHSTCDCNFLSLHSSVHFPHITLSGAQNLSVMAHILYTSADIQQ